MHSIMESVAKACVATGTYFMGMVAQEIICKIKIWVICFSAVGYFRAVVDVQTKKPVKHEMQIMKIE